MYHKRLQIKLLTKGGEVANCINCFSGQITVLRADSEEALTPYLRALAGMSGAERIILNFENNAYQVGQTTQIGFAERLPYTQSIHSLLENMGIKYQAISGLISTYGLEEATQISKIGQLTPCQLRRLQFLIARVVPTPILVLNDPFEPISFPWREKVAKLILDDTTANDRVTIIPLLTYRPQGWIDNHAIVRIQVGESIQKTIGFTSDSEATSRAIDLVRRLVKDEEAVGKIIATHIQHPKDPLGQKKPQDSNNVSQVKEAQNNSLLQRYQSLLMPTALIFLTVVVFVLYMRKSDNSSARSPIKATSLNLQKSDQILENKSPISTNELKNTTNLPANRSITKDNRASSKASSQIAGRATPGKYALDNYPEDIRHAVIAAINSNSDDAKPATYKPIKPKLDFNAKASELEQALKGLTPSSESSGSDPQPLSELPTSNSVNSEEDEARREIIREKFLEAINRAAQLRSAE